MQSLLLVAVVELGNVPLDWSVSEKKMREAIVIVTGKDLSALAGLLRIVS